MLIPNHYLEKVYAGFLGMNAGIRLGAPVEPEVWTDQRIQQVYGDLRGYVKEYINFAADDDANGPVFFIRALYDDARGRELCPEDVGKAWLNYAREGIGMFWWGGDGVSTEHTAFLNLKKGIPAPRSGAVETNGIIIAEQIGGQIFIDTWGLLFPGQIGKAADYAEIAASVSHDKNGLYGARFLAACIAAAFSENSMEGIIAEGLKTIPEDSTYAQVARAVIDFHKRHPEDFRQCRQFLEAEWGYDKYTGVCHIIPNAGVCVLALLYGEGDFARTIEIATMCGWDTDCNAGNVGTIVGVLGGLDAIPEHYRAPINDFIVTSSVSGYMNILDIPTFCKELALLAYEANGEQAPAELKEAVKFGEVYFDFELPGSTHGFRTDNPYKFPRIRHSAERGYNSTGSLQVLLDRFVDGDRGKLFYKPFYRRHDFNDERYKPTFAPQAKSGQTVQAKLYLEQWAGEDVVVTPYVRSSHSGEDILLSSVTLVRDEWKDIQFIIPDTDGAFVDEVGYIVESKSPLSNRTVGYLYIDDFHIYGEASYRIDFTKQREEFLCVTPFAHNRGHWTLDNGAMVSATEDDCAAFSGNYYTQDIIVEADLTPISGHSHCVLFRAPGIQRQYLAGFDGEGKLSLMANDFGVERLESVDFDWKHGKSYRLRIECIGKQIAVSVDGKQLIDREEGRYTYGMFGFANLTTGGTRIENVQVRELKVGIER